MREPEERDCSLAPSSFSLSPDSRREIAVFASAMTLVSSDTRGCERERERLTTEAEAVEADAGSLVERSYQVTRDVTRVRLMLRGRSSGSGGEGDCFVLSIRVDGFSDQDLTWRHWTSTEGERETSESGSLSHARVHTRCSEREREREREIERKSDTPLASLSWL